MYLEKSVEETLIIVESASPYKFVSGFIFVNLVKDRSNVFFDKDEIARAVEDFESHKEADEEFAKKVGIRNKIDASVHSINGMMDSINSDADKGKLSDLKGRLETISREEDTSDNLERKYNKIMEEVSAISQRMYEAGSADPTPQPSNPKYNEEDIIEGEII
jgi:hypothetical protein